MGLVATLPSNNSLGSQVGGSTLTATSTEGYTNTHILTNVHTPGLVSSRWEHRAGCCLPSPWGSPPT